MATIQELQKQIKSNEIMSLYLLYGEEAYLLNHYKKLIVDAALDGDKSMNYQYFQGEQTTVDEIKTAVVTLPFLATKRVIVVEGSGLFSKANEALANILASIPESATLIFVENKVMKTLKASKAAQKYGCVVEMNSFDESKLITWIAAYLNKQSWQIEKNAAVTLIRRCQNDLIHIVSELEKLMAYTIEEKIIKGEDVTLLTPRPVEDEIFKMIEAVALKDQKRALDYYYDLLMLRKPPVLILNQMIKHFRALFKISCSLPIGGNNQEIAGKIGIPPFAVNKYVAQSKKFTPKILKEAVEEGINFEKDIKSGIIADRLAVELFIIKYSSDF